jgi:DNA-3-methyladenine glycosylase
MEDSGAVANHKRLAAQWRIDGRCELMKKLPRSFYRRDAIDLARALIGTVLVHRIGKKVLRCRIVETEAYVGEHDLASHASKGRTTRTEVMFGPPGVAYVYLCYGIHEMFNIVCGKTGDAQAVLIRAAEPLDDLHENLSGPGKLTRGMKITRKQNGIDLLGDELFLMRDSSPATDVKITRRIGIDYAKHWKDVPLRFIDAESAAVSRPGFR